MNSLWSRRDHSQPANFEDNYYIYDPNLPAAVVALVLWFVVLVAIVYRSWRFKVWYFTVVVVGLTSTSSYLIGINFSSGSYRIHNESLRPLSFECI
jgi:membrane protein YdbS with pleckstrin-like domain